MALSSVSAIGCSVVDGLGMGVDIPQFKGVCVVLFCGIVFLGIL